MFASPAAGWFYSNQNNAQPPCQHCGGGVRHERWCVTRNPLVQYAFRVVSEPGKLAFADRLILHALGASWAMDRCEEGCKQVAFVSEPQPLESEP